MSLMARMASSLPEITKSMPSRSQLVSMNGRSKGFGFVEMSTEEEAKKAVEMFDGKELDGRELRVNEARPMQKRFDNGGGFNN